jgi:hypothetical protein
MNRFGKKKKTREKRREKKQTITSPDDCNTNHKESVRALADRMLENKLEAELMER